MTGPFSQKPWQPVLFRSMVPARLRFSSSLRSEAMTLSAPEALQPLPAHTEMHGRVVSLASRHSCSSLISWGDLSFSMARLVRLGCLRRLGLFLIFLEQPAHLGLRKVRMGIAVVHARYRR